jgi:type IV pilus assembly protein PilC
MALYSYKAIDPRGKSITGQIDAVNMIDLEVRLQRIDLDLVRCSLASKRGLTFRSESVKRSELINFCFHLEQMLIAGVPLVECLTDIRSSVDNSRFAEVLAGVIESIQGGENLSAALSNYPNIFNPVFCSLISSGEQTGRLPEVLHRSIETLKWEDELSTQTRRLMIYPAFVGGIVLIVVLFLMLYLVPQMVGFIRGMGGELPLHTQILIATSNFFSRYWWLILGIPPATILTVHLWANARPDFKLKIDRAKLAIPIIGPVLQKIILSRFATTFALMYSSGITVIDAMRSAQQGAGNMAVGEGLRQVGQRIAEGVNITRAFDDAGLFPALVIRMLRVGESTGAMDTALLNVSYFYNREVRDSIARMQVMIEPTLTVILGVVLGWVMLSVLGPIYDTVSKVKL